MRPCPLNKTVLAGSPDYNQRVQTRRQKHGNCASEIIALQMFFFYFFYLWNQWLGLANLHTFVLSLRGFSSFVTTSIYLLLLFYSEYKETCHFLNQQPPTLSLPTPAHHTPSDRGIPFTLYFFNSAQRSNFWPPKRIHSPGSVSLCLIFSVRWSSGSRIYFKM